MFLSTWNIALREEEGEIGMREVVSSWSEVLGVWLLDSVAPLALLTHVACRISPSFSDAEVAKNSF